MSLFLILLFSSSKKVYLLLLLALSRRWNKPETKEGEKNAFIKVSSYFLGKKGVRYTATCTDTLIPSLLFFGEQLLWLYDLFQSFHIPPECVCRTSISQSREETEINIV